MTQILLIVIGILAVWTAVLTYLYLSQQRFFKIVTQGVSKRDLKTILKNIAKSLKTAGEELNQLDESIKSIQQGAKHHFQKIGFVRYNPFSDTGGDQSFCLCLLNQHNTGFLLTSLHSREQTRIYAKSIVDGKSPNAELSKEETQALSIALKSKQPSLTN